MDWFTGQGRIVYDPTRPKMARGAEWWVILETDKEITRYYRYFVDKEILNPLGFSYAGLSEPSFDAHVSVIRGWNDVRHNFDVVKSFWKKYQGERITFRYTNCVRYSGDTTDNLPNVFWFVEVESPELLSIRKEMGLICSYPLHLTIGRIYYDRLIKGYKHQIFGNLKSFQKLEWKNKND